MFKGQFKFKNTSGQSSTYIIGDVVIYQGKVYECQNATQKSPIQKPSDWKFTGMTENTISENAPLNPVQGQVWTSSNGISYTWFVDDNSSQWIET